MPKEALARKLSEIAKAILAASPAALRLAKRCIDRGAELDSAGALQVELAAIDEQLASGSWLGKQ